MLAVESLRFDLPPVRSVRLAYYLQTPSPILALHAGELRQVWRESYPDATETAPRAPINGDADEAFPLDDIDCWPVPFFNFDNAETERGIFFQSDRFGLGWNFSEKQDFRYPGFDVLANEMMLRYSQFVNVLPAPPLLVSAECYYRNELPGVRVSEYVLGLLTGWDETTQCVSRRDDEGITFSQHYHLDDDGDRPVWLHASSGDEDNMTLRLTTRVEDLAGKEPEQGLRIAHDMLITCFVESTSDSMRADWGQQ